MLLKLLRSFPDAPLRAVLVAALEQAIPIANRTVENTANWPSVDFLIVSNLGARLSLDSYRSN
jgi:hypothetical protein